ncbi:MAG TPA: hypothetical protein PLW02_08640 [Verrucomicrobiota bacterium]|nr:hypothetical protein [Verrucomicrobiota bacterium]
MIKSINKLSVVLATQVILGFVVLMFGCNTRQRFDLNYGSELQAVYTVVNATIDYHAKNGRYPFYKDGLRELEPYGVLPQIASLVYYLNTNDFSVELTTNTIYVISAHCKKDSKTGECFYAGLISGEVVIVPKNKAHLGLKWSPLQNK